MRAPTVSCHRLAALLVCFAGCSAVPLVSRKGKQDEYGLRCRTFDKSSVNQYVTAIVPTSARPQDAQDGLGLQVLKDTIGSIRKILGLQEAHIVAAFDALPEDRSESSQSAYTSKIANFSAWSHENDGAITIFQNSEWTHGAEMLHRVFEFLESQGRLTPLVYIAQDDSPVRGEIDVPFIMGRLSCDEDVDYVRFLWSEDCSKGHAVNWNQPCIQHNETRLLQSVDRMSDRPHFATTKFYMEQIFPHCPRTYRGAPERKVMAIKGAWIYGERGHMLHETNVLERAYNSYKGVR